MKGIAPSTSLKKYVKNDICTVEKHNDIKYPALVLFYSV